MRVPPVLQGIARAVLFGAVTFLIPCSTHCLVVVHSGLHARTVVLISRPALRLMSEDELRAVVAHEAAHEYVHAEYERARAEGRSGLLQDLELVCDIIAWCCGLPRTDPSSQSTTTARPH